VAEHTGSDWPTYDARMEALVHLRAIAENRDLAREDRDAAFHAAGRYSPTIEEWREARRIEERRHALTQDRQQCQHRHVSPPLYPVSDRFGGELYGPPRPDHEDGGPVVSQARVMALVARTIANLGRKDFVGRSPAPPSYRVRTDPATADSYWYTVGLERARREWMVAKVTRRPSRVRKPSSMRAGLTYWPRLAIHRADLDTERPR
jgi:hypothetical protein